METRTELVFVTGASRSGTTMLANLLGLHGRMHCLRESHYFGDLFAPAGEGVLEPEHARRQLAWLLARQQRDVWGGTPEEADHQRARKLAGQLDCGTGWSLFHGFARLQAQAAGKRIPVEQTPRNIFYGAELLERYPEARLIEMVRDPRAVLWSQRRRWRQRSRGAQVPLGQALRVLVNYHALTMSQLWNRAAAAGAGLAGHPRFFSLRYEDLVSDPETMVAALCAFLGVEFESGMLAVSHRTSSTRDHDPAGRGIYADALNRWECGLPRGDRALCERLTRAQAAHHGYRWEPCARDLPWMFWHLLRYPLHMAGVLLLNPRRAWSQLQAILGRSWVRGETP